MKLKQLLIFIIFCGNISWSQTGPGGVGNTSSNGLWLKADEINQLNNTSLATWSDFSGNNNDANQTNTSLQPIYFETSSINNMPIVRLDGSNDEMAVSDSPILDGSSGINFYTVLRPNNLDGSPRGILGKRITFTDPAEYAYTWFFHGSNRLNLDVNTQNNRFNTGGTTFSNANNYILSWDFDGTLASSVRSRMRTGSTNILSATESSTAVSASNQDIAIGALNVNYGTYLGADYAEIIHFNYALDTVDHILVQNYLSAKYNISIVNNDLYKQDDASNGNYDFDVAGIGQVSASEYNDDAQGSGIVRILNPTGLNDNEFLIWGHDGGTKQADEMADIPTPLQARFSRVWRVNEVNGTGTAIDVGTIDIRFDLTGLGAVTSSDLRLLIDTDNDGFFNDETPISGASNLGGNIYEFSSITAIQNNLRFTIGTINTAQTPLPIELVYFNASLNNDNVVTLTWETASENNNDYFTIERSRNVNDWTSFSTIQGAGQSSASIKYSEIDFTPFPSITYYRLKQTDFDGKLEYSAIKSVQIKNINSLQIFPNPTKNELYLVGNKIEISSATLYNIIGQDITPFVQLTYQNEKQLFMDLTKLKPGIYFIKTSNCTHKVVKQ